MIEITGYIEKIVYRKEETGYTVFEVSTQEEEYICVGSLSMADVGERIRICGEVVFHPEYGEQIKIKTYEMLALEDIKSIERYLGSGAIKGVGEALAARIVKKFGDKTYEIMEKEPERLAEIKGISARMAREIGVQIYEKRDTRNALSFLQQYGISNTMAVRIYEQYGQEIYSILRENPYRLAEDISGIGFKLADEIAKQAGIVADSEFRMQSGLLYALRQAMGEGHMYLPKDELLARAGQLLALEPENMETMIDNLAIERRLVHKPEEQAVYMPVAYYSELQCARLLRNLQAPFAIKGRDQEQEHQRIINQLYRIEDRQGIHLDELQREAVVQSALHGVSILTGGPGTGKTTAINAMIQYFYEEGLDILLAAPTGRAAKRMSEATGYEAKTIHRMLEISGAMMQEEGMAKFERNEDNPLEADVIIIDEMSMVDCYLLQSLLKAISVGTRLIMVGDRNQLPSVGPGRVLQDIIASGAFPVTRLEKIFRQAKDSDIVLNAHRIHEGNYLSLDNKSEDFFFLERSDIQVIYKHMIQLIREKLPPYIQCNLYDIQVLTPMRKGPLGVETLNQILQQYLNPQDDRKQEYDTGKVLFRQGDKVMQIKNNYQLEWKVKGLHDITVDQGTGVFNGDIGIVREINEIGRYLQVEFDDQRLVNYSLSSLEELELAYAITVHKSQGSEYPGVILPLLHGPRMLCNRNLLYTAITRAKSCVTILGSEKMVKQMIDNTYETKRYTGLCKRLTEE